MAKVIGFDNSAKKKVTCKECAAIIEYVPKEEKSYVHRDYGGGSDTVYYIDCPNCQNKITVRRY
jgi:ribosomal protein S27E